MTNRVRTALSFLWLLLTGILYLGQYPLPDLLSYLPAFTFSSIPGYLALSAGLYVIFLLAAFGWGMLIFRRRDLSRLEIVLFAAGIGIGAMSLALLGLNIAGALTPVTVILLNAAGIILLIFLIPGGFLRPVALSYAWLLLIGLLPLASSCIGALAPPTQFDSLVYHLGLPMRYLQHGRLYDVPFNFFFSFPQNMEMLFSGALALNNDILANLISWGFLPLTALAVFAFGRRFFSMMTALAAAAVWLFIPEILFISTGTYVDGALAFFIFAAVYAVVLARHEGEPAWYLWAGVFCGIACGIKYTAAISGLILAVLIIGLNPPGSRLKPVATFILAALSVFSPWLVKNAVLLHNPVAPWGAAVFAHSAIPLNAARTYTRHIGDHGLPIRNLYDLVMMPWNITVRGYQYGGAFDLPGPFFLLFIPVLFFSGKSDKIIRFLVLFSVAFVLLWLGTGKVLRFLVPLFPVLALIAAAGITAGATTRFRKGIVLFFLSAGMLHSILLFHDVMAEVDPYRPVLGGEDRSRYLSRMISCYGAIENGVNRLSGTACTLFWGETRGYFCRTPSIVPTVFDAHPLPQWVNAAASPGDISRRLKENGITHVLVNTTEANRLKSDREFTPDGVRLWEAWRAAARTIYEDRNCLLYEL